MAEPSPFCPLCSIPITEMMNFAKENEFIHEQPQEEMGEQVSSLPPHKEGLGLFMGRGMGKADWLKLY